MMLGMAVAMIVLSYRHVSFALKSGQGPRRTNATRNMDRKHPRMIGIAFIRGGYSTSSAGPWPGPPRSVGIGCFGAGDEDSSAFFG